LKRSTVHLTGWRGLDREGKYWAAYAPRLKRGQTTGPTPELLAREIEKVFDE
jgi:hypothetical protein